MNNEDLILSRLMDIHSDIGEIRSAQREAKDDRDKTNREIAGLRDDLSETDKKVAKIIVDRRISRAKFAGFLGAAGVTGGVAGNTIWDFLSKLFKS